MGATENSALKPKQHSLPLTPVVPKQLLTSSLHLSTSLSLFQSGGCEHNAAGTDWLSGRKQCVVQSRAGVCISTKAIYKEVYTCTVYII